MASAADEVSLPPADDVRRCMADWRMPNDDFHFGMAAMWYTMVKDNSYYATAFKVPYVMGDASGIFLIISTALSSYMYKENMMDMEASRMITDPYWLYYSVYQFAGMSLLNFADFGNSKYDGHQPFVDFRTMLAMVVFAKTPQWKDLYCRITGGSMFMDSIRKVFQEGMGVTMWAEITVGRSWHVYCGLDFYIRVYTTGMRPPRQEAWYLLNGSSPHNQRRALAPEDWWVCKDFQAYGQREVIADWYMDIFVEATSTAVARGMSPDIVMPPGIFHSLPTHVREFLQNRYRVRARL